jgi:hypothetical protein
VSTRSPFLGLSDRDVKLTTHLHLVLSKNA